jgi:hypothetical protein
MPLSDLSGEIELIRIALKRSLHVQNESTEPLDFEAQMSALRALTLGVESINSMIRTQFILLSARRGIDEWGAQVKKALDELTAAQESLATEAGEPSDGRLPEIVDGMLATAAGEDAGDGPPEA